MDRHAIAGSTVFVSHETYTPARGGSASAEIHALRQVFGADADAVVITNTKGFTGHAMGAGIEDVVAIKALETGIVPPVPNFKEPDPELGTLNLSTGGSLPGPVRAAAGRRIRLADRDDAAALDAGARRPPPPAGRTRLRVPDRRPGGLAALAGAGRRYGRPGSWRSCSTGCGSSTRGADRRTGPAPVAGPGRKLRRSQPAAACAVTTWPRTHRAARRTSGVPRPTTVRRAPGARPRCR